jgi:hypothetical protein
MSIHLQKMRLYATTKDQNNAGTDDGVDLWMYIDPHSLTTFPLQKPPERWLIQKLDHDNYNDRERGRTDSYDVDFQGGDLGMALSGTSVPRGIAFNDWVAARSFPIFLRMKGNDWWRIDSYSLLGYFQELSYVPGTIDSFKVINHYWRLMAQQSEDIDMSTDPSEGTKWHHIQLNGPF